jgi:hypothetical protein
MEEFSEKHKTAEIALEKKSFRLLFHQIFKLVLAILFAPIVDGMEKGRKLNVNEEICKITI